MSALTIESILLTALSTSDLSSHLDQDSSDYLLSILQDDPIDSDARDAVSSFVRHSIDDSDDICSDFFLRLDSALAQNGSDSTSPVVVAYEGRSDLPRRLENAVTLKSHDIQTFASGLVADDLAGRRVNSTTSDIQSFYANMIDVSNHPGAVSERERRKARQREVREKVEEEERKRAIEDALRMIQEEDDTMGEEKVVEREDMGSMTNLEDNAIDVHFTNFNLPNRKGGGSDLLMDAALILAGKRRYGLLGRNGCGKTTLLTALATRQIGGIGGGVPKNMSMLLVRQEIMGNDLSAVETVLKSDVKREGVKRWIEFLESELTRLDNPCTGDDLLDKITTSGTSKGKQKLNDRKKNKSVAPPAAVNTKSLTKKKSASQSSIESLGDKRKKLNSKLTNAYERLVRIEQEEGGDPEPRARKVLFGLGFTTPEIQDKPTKELSGGWRMRVSLSCALFANPSLLLLDEPTNHLDLEAVLWLEKYLTTQFRGTLVVVSHDRHFLNEVVTDVVHFHQGKLITYRGDINNFIAVREENRKRQIRLFEQQEAKRAHLQKYIDLHAQAGENGVKAARQRKSRMKKLDKLGVMSQEGKKFKASYDGEADEVEEYVEDEEVVLSFPDPGGFDGDIVRLEIVSFGYTPEHMLLQNVDLSIDMKSRVALLGRNGCGKSTLIKVIVGALQPNKGKVSINARAKIEYLAQHQLEQLDPDGTPLETMLDRYPGDHGNAHILELRRYLANFGLGGDELPTQKINTMSGGQKCRLCLAAAMYRKPHLLILDEPTNHLDMETTEALIEAIKQFPGGVLLVSHDQHLLTSVCKDLFVVEKGNVELLRHGNTNGDAFERYKKDVILGRR